MKEECFEVLNKDAVINTTSGIFRSAFLQPKLKAGVVNELSFEIFQKLTFDVKLECVKAHLRTMEYVFQIQIKDELDLLVKENCDNFKMKLLQNTEIKQKDVAIQK